GAGCCAEPLSAAGAGCVLPPALEEAAAASFTCPSGGAVVPGGGVVAAGCRSFFISGTALLSEAALAGDPFPDPPGTAPAGAVVGGAPASERGTGAFAAGTAPFSTRSTPTLLEPPRLPMMLLLAARTISGALTCLGSTSVGSPTLAASDTSGPLWKFSINFPKWPSGPRLAISALSSATAASVACGTGCFIACNRFLASSARSSRG